MLSAEDNRLLTEVGPGTAGGELLRRYWWPVSIVPDVNEANPTQHVRILGEDLVLFRDRSGRAGLLADHCPHRGASLLYGRVEERGIACAYHGWLYDVEGNCLETPAEPSDSRLYLTIKHRAYPVRERYGLYWAYLGPPPAPVLPRYDFAEIGPISVGLTWQDCNWLQVVENNLDQSHTYILHQAVRPGGIPGSNSARGVIDQMEGIEYIEAPFGIRRRRVDKNGYDDTDLMVFPSSARIYNHMSIKVPIDDHYTKRYSVNADLGLGGHSEAQAGQPTNGEIRYRQDRDHYKSRFDAIHPDATYRMDKLQWQDYMVLETQGAIWTRQHERLGTADRGLVLLRNMLKREIDKVQQGLDPMGVIRDPAQDLIDTYIDVYLDMVRQGKTQLGLIG